MKSIMFGVELKPSRLSWRPYGLDVVDGINGLDWVESDNWLLVVSSSRLEEMPNGR
jgi:hypothetical protein